MTKPNQTAIVWVNISQIADYVGSTRETVRDRLSAYPDLPKRRGRKGGTEFPSAIALPIAMQRGRAAFSGALRVLSMLLK